jgi:hypothetical protein
MVIESELQIELHRVSYFDPAEIALLSEHPKTLVSFLESEIQLAGYKILNSLWVIGTKGTIYVDR